MLVDPSYAFPIPIFVSTISRSKSASAGYAVRAAVWRRLRAGTFSVANRRTPFDASLDFFGIAVRRSRKSVYERGERESERLLSWSMSAGTNAGWQATAFQKLTLQYSALRPYSATALTAETYVVLRVPRRRRRRRVGYKRGGYAGVVGGTWHALDLAAGGLKATCSRPRAPTSSTQPTSGKDVFSGPFRKSSQWRVSSRSGLDRFSRWQLGSSTYTASTACWPASARRPRQARARTRLISSSSTLDVFIEQAWCAIVVPASIGGR